MKNSIKKLKQNKNFFDKIAPYYDKRIFSSFLLNPIKKTIDFIDIKENSKILDAGCGTGNLLHLLDKKIFPNGKIFQSGIKLYSKVYIP